MKLGIKELKKITLGVIDIIEKDNKFLFRRLTESQLSTLTDRGYESRAKCAASVKLEFYTKGGEISFNYYITKGSNREYYSIDLLEDGVFKYNVSKDAYTDEGVFKYNIPYSENEKRITVYMPTTAHIKISVVSLPDDFKPHKRDKMCLFLGDSMVQGYYPNHSQNSYTNIFSDHFNINLINQGIGGDVFFEGNLEKIPEEPEKIFVAYGANDWASGKFKNGEDAEAYFKKLHSLYPNTPVFALIPRKNIFFKQTNKNDDMILKTEEKHSITREFVREKIAEIAGGYVNIKVIDTDSFVPLYSESFYSDNVHFTDLGNVFFAYKLIEELKS